jgi:hypothetical protein
VRRLGPGGATTFAAALVRAGGLRGTKTLHLSEWTPLQSIGWAPEDPSFSDAATRARSVALARLLAGVARPALLPDLETLKIGLGGLVDEDARALSSIEAASQIKTVMLPGAEQYDKKPLFAALSGWPRLEVMQGEEFYAFSLVLDDEEKSGAFPSLREISLMGGVLEALLRGPDVLPSLERLECIGSYIEGSYVQRLTDLLSRPSRMDKLTSVRLPMSLSSECAADTYLALFKALGALPALKHLQPCGIGIRDFEGTELLLEALATPGAFPHLQDLDLSLVRRHHLW